MAKAQIPERTVRKDMKHSPRPTAVSMTGLQARPDKSVPLQNEDMPLKPSVSKGATIGKLKAKAKETK